MTRQCGSCTKCCEGHLYAEIYGQELTKGNACRFLTDKCSIYDLPRPHVCGEFRCGWLRNEKNFLPDWMRPDISKQIIIFHRLPECEWFEVVSAGEQMSIVMLTWLVGEAKRKNLNLKYKIEEQVFLIGDETFKKLAG